MIRRFSCFKELALRLISLIRRCLLSHLTFIYVERHLELMLTASSFVHARSSQLHSFSYLSLRIAGFLMCLYQKRLLHIDTNLLFLITGMSWLTRGEHSLRGFSIETCVFHAWRIEPSIGTLIVQLDYLFQST